MLGRQSALVNALIQMLISPRNTFTDGQRNSAQSVCPCVSQVDTKSTFMISNEYILVYDHPIFSEMAAWKVASEFVRFSEYPERILVASLHSVTAYDRSVML